MCLNVKENVKVVINEKPILTWKYVKIHGGQNKKWDSPIYRNGTEGKYFGTVYNAQHTVLTQNYKTVWVDLEHIVIYYGGVVDAAYHSFHSPIKLWWLYSNLAKSNCIRPCVIPVGSETIEGTDGDIASTKIIVFKNIFQAIKYCRTNKK